MFEIALTLFLVANPLGNAPAIVALVKDFSLERQKFILLRESLIALALALFFQYFGELFLSFLNVQDFTVSFSGGTLLFLVALSMIFSSSTAKEQVKLKQEPFIVPIATPILSGPGLLAVIMHYGKAEGNNLKVSLAILIAWVGVISIVYAAPYLKKVLGEKGMLALEQLMGMLLAMMAVEMMIRGVTLFMETLQG